MPAYPSGYMPHRWSIRIVCCLAIGLIAWSASSARAIVARHDVADEKLCELGAGFPAVGRVLPDGVCTLVDPRWVVTAAHVAAGLEPGNGRVLFADREYQVKRVVSHPKATGPEGMPPEVDLALVELAEPVEGVAGLAWYTAADELGKTVTCVGYGDTGDGQSAPKRGDGRRRAATNMITDAGPVRLFFVFDAPPDGTPIEGVSGPGDSGGPALIKVGGVWRIAGISSAAMNGKPGRYGVTEVYTRVSRFADWIEATIRGGNTDAAEKP